MNFIDLSMEKLKSISICAAEKIAEDHQIDLLIYIAQAGFPIAFYMNTIFQCRLLGIDTARKGNRIKSALGKVLRYMPKPFKNFLRCMEIKFQMGKSGTERSTAFHASLQDWDRLSEYSILIVDDSADTGNSMKQVVTKVSETFPNADITVYTMNVFEKSRALATVDYFTFENTVLRTPMSKDSKEYKLFCELYQRETLNGYL